MGAGVLVEVSARLINGNAKKTNSQRIPGARRKYAVLVDFFAGAKAFSVELECAIAIGH